jgi:hypothetical protein
VLILVSGTTRTLRRLAPGGGLGQLLTPASNNRLIDGLPWAADNGAFAGLDVPRFRRLLARITGRPRCLFVACPDVVADAAATLASWRVWREEVAATGQPVAFVGQDGLALGAVPWADMGAYFVGGSTAWKLSDDSRRLAAEAKRRGLWLHMGRVNSLTRLRLAYEWGCDSVDGSSASRNGDVKLPPYLRWVRSLAPQRLLFGPRAWRRGSRE